MKWLTAGSRSHILTAMSTPQLRDYQRDIKARIYHAWNTEKLRFVCAVLPTGSGKTVVFSDIVREHRGGVAVIAHRQELVGQISLALARCEVTHQVIGPSAVVKACMLNQMQEVGRTYYDPRSSIAVCGVDTLLRRDAHLKHWAQQVTLWVMDETHHLLRENKWGKAVSMFPNARGLGVTATPVRADGKGIGMMGEGVMEILLEGPPMRELIKQGHLCDYTVYVPPSDVHVENVPVSSSTGDYSLPALRKVVRESHLVGDVVDHYLRIARGKLGVTFTTDVETAKDIADQYKVAGVAAEVVSAKTPDSVRMELIRRFRRRELSQLVNVDIFGEGFDLPALDVVSMARPTQSFALYSQQFGRALRPMRGKDRAIIIDHAGNVLRHGLPDRPRQWSLLSGDKRPRTLNPDDEIPLRYCAACTRPYERIYRRCPYCGHYPEPAARSTPHQVDGDLTELSPEVLATLRGEVDRHGGDPIAVGNRMRAAGAPDVACRGAVKSIRVRQNVQDAIREIIGWWASIHPDKTDSEKYRLFYFLFGVDVLTAQTLPRSDTVALADRINDYIGRRMVNA